MIRRLTCPICNKDLPLEIDGESPIFPFCSSRCKQVDLYRWMSGEYALIEPLTPDKLMEQIPEEDLPPELRG
ncbi:DNA gyrase inhibitor YacG [Planctomicrobium sp. SH664]|uniref:DNA gyrase inhibitor YacG n=1 Tax=Planctomicrobium sp. SH664 TaxID=3448125 RepID=UPI003F5BFFEC